MIPLPNIGGLAKIGKAFVAVTRRPEILFGTSIAAELIAVVAAARAGWNARGKADEAEAEAGRPLTRTEQAMVTWPCYVAPGVATLGAVGATTGLHLVHVKDKKAIAAAAMAAIDEVRTESAAYAKDVQEALDENLTPKKAEQVDAAIEEKAEVRRSETYVEDYYLVTDGRTQRPIWSNKITVEEAVVLVNQILNNDPCSVNTFYSLAGFDTLPDGDEYGWNAKADILTIEWKTSITGDGKPCRVFTFQPAPKQGFDPVR